MKRCAIQFIRTYFIHEIIIRFLFETKIRTLAKIYYLVQLVWNRFIMNDREALFDIECPNVKQMWQLLIDYVYPIITDIWLWFSVRLPMIYTWHCHSLWAALSSNVGAWVWELAHSFFHSSCDACFLLWLKQCKRSSFNWSILNETNCIAKSASFWKERYCKGFLSSNVDQKPPTSEDLRLSIY